MEGCARFVVTSVLVFILVFLGPLPGATAQKKRELPDYDSRPDEKKAEQNIVLFLPRLVFRPVYWATEYGIRQPLGWLITTAERKKWPAKLKNLFVFGPDDNITLYPSAFFDFGVRPSGGLNLAWKDFLAENNRIHFRAVTGGSDWVSLAIDDTIAFSGKRSRLTWGGAMNIRPDWNFYGISPRSLEANKSHYKANQKDANLAYQTGIFRQGSLNFGFGLRDTAFADGDSPGIEQLIASGAYPAPPGFQNGYTIFRQTLDLTYGDRISRPKSKGGLQTKLSFEHAFDLNQPGDQRWIHYGETVAGFVNLYNQDRILSLAVDTHFVDILNSNGQVPFTELASMGGTGPLPGFVSRRLLGESAASMTLAYHWPIWAFFDGNIHYAAGNVFGKHLDGFRAGLLRQSVGVGIQTVEKASQGFSLLVAWGSEPFDEGGSFNEFRFLVGTSRGF